MPLDVNIGTIKTRADILDPEAMLSPRLIAQITQRVKEDINREKEIDAQRQSDRQGMSSYPGRGD